MTNAEARALRRDREDLAEIVKDEPPYRAPEPEPDDDTEAQDPR